MNRTQSSILLALGLALSACGSSNRGVDSIHQPVVSRNDYVLDVFGGPAGLSPSDENRLRGWFDSLQLGYGDKVSVDTAGLYGGEETRRSVSQIAARYGILLQEAAPATPGEIAPGTARVIVSRLKAAVPTCPDWSGASWHTFNNQTHSNYGCSTNSNLAAMVAEPEDLVRGKTGDAEVDAALASKAIKAYRDAPATGAKGLKTENTGSKSSGGGSSQ